ncbi:unnamed protein product [Rotaria sp. Silwood1]|nr:unnamed protein product [Rotaria sp. Silwood1]
MILKYFLFGEELMCNIFTCVCRLCQKSTNFCRNLNLFSSIPPSTNEFDLRNERISTRIFILLLFLSTTTLIIHTSLVNVTKTVNIHAPSFKTYSQLYLIHSQTLICPCTTISIEYKKFLYVNYTFHQVCSSIYVMNNWINNIALSFDNQPYDPTNFRWAGTNIFQALSTFCGLTNKTIFESLNRFYLNQYISNMVTPSSLFKSHIQSAIKQFRSSTTNHFLLSLEIVRDTSQANALLSAKQTNILLYFAPRSTFASVVPLAYDGCDCGYSAKCIQQAAIYSYPNLTMLFSIPGLYLGCFVIESLLQSTLECFYNQTCINLLQSYLVSNLSMNIIVLDSSLPSRFLENSTIQELVNELMIEQWNLSTMYENYYHACQPIRCTYSYATRNDLIYIMTTLFGLVGGMLTILKFLVPLLVKLIVKIKAPTLKKYSRLSFTHFKTLTCPCKTISINYQNFLHIKYKFHQICNSIYITDNWINYIDGRSGNEILAMDDFRWTGTNIFRALNSFCKLINKTISESLNRFYLTQYISATITSKQLFQSQIQSMFEQFISSTTKDLLLSLQIIRDTNQANGLWSIAGVQYSLYKQINFNNLLLMVRDYFRCSCDHSAKCIRQSSIYRYSDGTLLFSIPGLYLGCFAIEALLQSNLECFYNQTCINQLQTYLTHFPFMNVTALDSSLPSRFYKNSTIQELMNKLMIEQWNLSMMYESYYNACQPIQCSYSYTTRNDLIYIVTTLFGLAGGMVTILKFIVPLLVKLVRRNKRLPMIRLENNIDQPTIGLCQKSANFCRNLNLFSSMPPSTREFDLRNERIATRLFILLLFLSTTTLIIHTSLVNVTKTVNIHAPSFKTYSQLYLIHSQTLTCPCTTISIEYKKFLYVNYTFHQVCNSLYITDIWREHLTSSLSNITLYFRDFRASRKFLFQALSTFCALTNRTVFTSLDRFYSNRYISITVTSSQMFQLQMQSIFKQFISSTTNDLLLSLQIIRNTTQTNAFFSGRWTNYDLYPTFSPRLPKMEILAPYPQYYSNCRCDVSMTCIEQSAIYDSMGTTKLFSIPGIYKGCFIIESLLQSTLECFYKQKCIDQLQSYLIYDFPMNMTVLDSSLPSRFFENSTIQELVNELMIEQWNLSTMYENYYNACQPVRCTYGFATKNSIIYIVTIVFGLVGGIVTILKLIIPQFVKLIAYFFF